MAGRLIGSILLLACAAPVPAQPVVYTYTENPGGEHTLALGYPVPEPVHSLAPVHGFRAYESLHARLQDLALKHVHIAGQPIGETVHGRGIWAYTVSDRNGTSVEGLPEPAFLINGTIHAREWQSPEVVTGIVERFAARGSDGGLYQYLVENTNLVAVPVLNVDGFLQTQRYPARVILGTDPRFPDSAPRDGRMRRKNMKGADEDLFTFSDHLNGVDLNRNNPPFAPSPQASSNPDSLVFHGKGAHNQPETKALLRAAALAPPGRLRLYTDFHSFAQAFYDPLTRNARRNAIQGRLIEKAQTVLLDHASNYSRQPSGPDFGLGSTDEYFAWEYQIPSWTLELEPRGALGGMQYNGFGVTHDGFILPESQVREMVDEIADTYFLLFYAQAGPPAVKAVKVFDARGDVVFAGEWQVQGDSGREFNVRVNGSLRPGGEYRLWVAFNKPMRRRDADGDIRRYFNVGGRLKPVFTLSGGGVELQFGAQGHWVNTPGGEDGYLRYRDDAFIAPFEVPEDIAPAEPLNLQLAIAAADLAGQHLDANPATIVDWGGGHWTGYESTHGESGDTGGRDRTIALAISTEGLDTLSFAQLEYEAREGSLVSVKLIREGSGTGAVTAKLASVTRPFGVPGSWFDFEVAWEDGETGARVVQVPVPQNITPADETIPGVDFVLPTVTLAVTEVNGPALAPGEGVVITPVDDDRANQGFASALYPSPFTAVSDGSADGFILLDESQRFGLRLCNILNQVNAVHAYYADRPVVITLRDHTAYEIGRLVCGDAAGADAIAPDIRSTVLIAGHESGVRRAGDAPAGRLFHVASGGELALTGLTLANGLAPGNRAGGAILNEGALSTERVIFHGNAASRAGALENRGTAKLEDSSFVANGAPNGGGAVFNQGELILQGVTFSANTTQNRGGAILNHGRLVIDSATFAANSATAGASLATSGSVEVKNSILADNGACVLLAGGELISHGYNLNPDGSCNLNGAGDIHGTAAGLAEFDRAPALYPLLQTSPAVDHGDPAGCGASDARGAPRPFGRSGSDARCDIGAFERSLTVHRGLWWNPARAGHGIDLQQRDNILFLTWFTYEADGDPTWYQAAAAFTDHTWQADLYAYHFDEKLAEVVGAVAGSVTLTFDSATRATFSWDLSAVGGGSGSASLQPFTPVDAAPLIDLSGTWAAADSSGWGLSVDTQGATTIATVYYYDGEGQARWVQGAAPSGVLDTAIAVSSFTGFCPVCAYEEPVAAPAGSIRLQFSSRLRANVQTDFRYPGAEGGAWQRSVILGPLSSPVP